MSLVIGGAVGAAAVALPSRVRVLGLFAVGAGLLAGLAVRWAADAVGVPSRRVRGLTAAAAAAAAVLIYGDRSAALLAAAERPKNTREGAAAILLEQMPAEVRGDIPVAPLPRWLRWRTTAAGLTGPWPAVVASVEAAACVAVAAVVASRGKAA